MKLNKLHLQLSHNRNDSANDERLHMAWAQNEVDEEKDKQG